MGLFDRKRKNAVQINETSRQPVPFSIGWDMLNPKKRGFKPFGEIYLNMCLNQLYSGISNVTFFTTEKGKENYVPKAICDFVDRNSTLLMNNLIYNGFIAVRYDKDYNYEIPSYNTLRFDQFGTVLNRNMVVIYSPLYQTKRKSLMMLVRPQIELIDTLANNLIASCGTMGVLPIISGNSIPANPKFKEDLAEAMSKEYGWGDDQMKYFLSQQELKVDKIDLQIKDLELRDNIESAFKVLLNYFEVPIDLVIGNSTYANVSSARTYFYESTIRKYAETLLRVSRALLTASPVFLPQSAITYRIENVAGIDKTISDVCEQRVAYIDALVKLKEAGVDVSDELDRVYADLKEDYKRV